MPHHIALELLALKKPWLLWVDSVEVERIAHYASVICDAMNYARLGQAAGLSAHIMLATQSSTDKGENLGPFREKLEAIIGKMADPGEQFAVTVEYVLDGTYKAAIKLL